ncbi:MAG: family 20 glycosylhydrolase [Acidobacteria bacterium]|nr:family 20 glycosylhydrolase [Acidobacteriota bacterium]
MRTKILPTLAFSIVFLLSGHAPETGNAQQAGPHLMPMPRSVELRPGRLSMDESFSVRLTGHRDARVSGAALRFLERLEKKTGIPLSRFTIGDPASATLEINCIGAGEPVQSAGADESYTLDVADQNARLTAPSPIGILRGLETLLQLVDLDDESFFMPAVRIHDEPRFRWRGLLIDVSRHWEPAEVIKRNLDAMAAVKMNVFHWHLSDDQGFRMESKAFPRLHQLGSEGKYYTQAEVKEIIAYARERGIRVIPEFDMPGHTTAILVAYPELAGAPGPYQIERFWGVFDPCMDPSSQKTYSFLDSFIGEMAKIFPDEYFHIGGDEVNGRQWNASPKIQAFKKQNKLKDNAALQAYFNRRLQKILAKHGKKMIGWDEILHPDLPKSVMIQSWRGISYLAGSGRRGYSGVLSNGYYLDAMRPASFHYGVDPLGKEATALSDEEKSRILGGEACMWAEFITPENIDSRIWPRTAAIAERLWSPAEINDVPDMYRRLAYVDRELSFLGLQHHAGSFKMLRRMTGDAFIAPLRQFAELLKPAGLGSRVKLRKYSSLMPLNRMADAVLPESDAARKFEDLVNEALAAQSGSPDGLRSVREQLSAWRYTARALKAALEQSFLLEEIGPAAEMIGDLTTLGFEAAEYLETRRKPQEEWIGKAAPVLEQAEKPHAEMLIAIGAPIKKLVEAASALP